MSGPPQLIAILLVPLLLGIPLTLLPHHLPGRALRNGALPTAERPAARQASAVLAGLLARLPLSMTGIGLITMLSQQRGSYTLAGMASAWNCASSALGIRVTTASAPAACRVLRASGREASLVPGQGVKIRRAPLSRFSVSKGCMINGDSVAR